VFRKVLEITGEESMPQILSAAAERLIDRVTVEKAAALLAEDLRRWEDETTVPLPDLTAA
jgi:hypothetical protein